MIDFYRKHKIEILIFTLALFLRIIFFSVNLTHNNFNVIPTIHGDDGYYEISQGILGGNGFTGDILPPYRPNPLRPPVWPIIIAFFVKIFGSYWSIAIFELIIGSLIPVLGFLITKKLFTNRCIFIGTGILLAIEPYGVLLSSLLYSETIFTFLFLICFLFLVRYFEKRTTYDLVWMSLFLGLATLAKLTIQYVPLVLAVFIFYDALKRYDKKLAWRNTLIMLSIFFLMIVPWISRNYIEFGRIGLGAQQSFNLYVYLVPTVLSIDNHTSFAEEHQNFVRKNNFDENNINLSNGDYYTKEAIEVLKQHKLALVKSVGTTVVTFFTHDGLLTIFQNAGIVVKNISNKPALSMLLSDPKSLIDFIRLQVNGWGIFILLARIIWIFVTIIFFFGIYRYLRNEKISIPILVAMILVAYFALTTSINGLGVNARFKVPVNIFIFAFFLYGLFSLKRDNILHKSILEKS